MVKKTKQITRRDLENAFCQVQDLLFACLTDNIIYNIFFLASDSSIAKKYILDR